MNGFFLRLFMGPILSSRTHSSEVLSSLWLLSLLGRTLRKTLAPKGLAVIVGLSAEAPTSYRPR